MSAPEAVPAVRTVIARALAPASFAPYGDVIAPGGSERDINFGTTRRFDDVTRLDVAEDGGRPCVAIFRTGAGTHRAPYPLRAFERHRLGSQTFVPMGASRCLAVLAGGGDAPDEDGIVAFIVEPGQGITLKRGIWHHPLITIGAADVLVIERLAHEEDCEVVALRGRIEVRLPTSAAAD